MKTILCAVVGATLAMSGSLRADDTVRKIDGESVVGKITASTYAGVKVEDAKTKKATDIPWAQVDSIAFKDTAKPLDDARRVLASGDHAAALAVLEPAVDDKKVRAVVRQEIGYLLAASLYALDRDADAEKAVEKLRTEFPTGRYAAGVVRLVADAALKKGDDRAAQMQIDKATREGKAASLPAAFEAEMRVLTGRVHEKSKRYDAAIKEYGAVANQSDLPADVIAEATLGSARSEIGAGRADGADAGLRKVVKMEISSSILVEAWNNLGEIALNKGRTSKNAEALNEATFHFLRGVVLYLPRAGESTYQAERALAGAAKAFQYLAEIETATEAQNNYRARSADRWNELKRSYPNSEFLKDAPR